MLQKKHAAETLEPNQSVDMLAANRLARWLLCLMDVRFRCRHLLQAVVLIATLQSCVVSPRSLNTVGQVAAMALWTAAIVGHVTLLAYHDAHYHYDHCGHYRRWHQDRWVYYYEDRWEYYDNGDGRWYVYVD